MIWLRVVSSPTRSARQRIYRSFHGRGGDLISLGLVDGDTLACQCRFIDRAAALDDNAVNGDALARTHGENIVLLELLYRYHALSVALDYRGGLG